MTKFKKDIWNYNMGVYDPVDGGVVRAEDGSWNATGVVYPYREGNFNLKWLEPYHPGRPEYWDKNYIKDER